MFTTQLEGMEVKPLIWISKKQHYRIHLLRDTLLLSILGSWHMSRKLQELFVNWRNTFLYLLAKDLETATAASVGSRNTLIQVGFSDQTVDDSHLHLKI